jgi:hypothetical protein
VYGTIRVGPIPTIGPHAGAAVLRALRGRPAALCGPGGHQEARGAVGEAGDRELRLARRPAKRTSCGRASAADPRTRGRRCSGPGRPAASAPPGMPRPAPAATALGGLPDGRGRAGCLPAGRGRRPHHPTAEFRRLEGAARPRRRNRGRGPRDPGTAAAGPIAVTASGPRSVAGRSPWCPRPVWCGAGWAPDALRRSGPR